MTFDYAVILVSEAECLFISIPKAGRIKHIQQSMCAGLSMRIGNIRCFPHGGESRESQQGISRKGFFCCCGGFLGTDLLCQETTFEQLPVFIFSLISVSMS